MPSKKSNYTCKVLWSAKDCAQFKKFVDKYLSRLGLTEWDVMVSAADFPDDMSGVGAMTHCFFDGKFAHMQLNRTGTHLFTLDHIAKHEVCEILLSDLDVLARMHNADKLVNEYRHAIVNRVMKLL